MNAPQTILQFLGEAGIKATLLPIAVSTAHADAPNKLAAELAVEPYQLETPEAFGSFLAHIGRRFGPVAVVNEPIGQRGARTRQVDFGSTRIVLRLSTGNDSFVEGFDVFASAA